jgi:hypothetical protein
MQRSRIMGGAAALAGAAADPIGPVVSVTLLPPEGLGDTGAEPGKVVGLLADNRSSVRAWYLITWLVCGACLILRRSPLSNAWSPARR